MKRKELKRKYKHLIEFEVYRGHKNIINKCYAKYFYPQTSLIYLIRKMQMNSEINSKTSIIKAMLIERKINLKFSCCIDKNAKIGKGIHFPHPTGIVIGSKTVIGDNCSIYQNTTIGGARIGDAKKGNQPIIGDNCIFFASSLVLGNVVVPNNTILGANSLLISSPDESGTYVGSPAKLVRGSND